MNKLSRKQELLVRKLKTIWKDKEFILGIICTLQDDDEVQMIMDFIDENDHVLIIDDFLANGEAATGAIRLIRKAHATIAGVGILIEKSFQPGHEKLKEQGIDVYSLARIAKMGENHIEFVEDEA